VDRGGVLTKAPGMMRRRNLIPETLRHGVIDRHVVIRRRAGGHRLEVRHAARETPPSRQPRRVHVVLHVILRRMGQHKCRV